MHQFSRIPRNPRYARLTGLLLLGFTFFALTAESSSSCTNKAATGSSSNAANAPAAKANIAVYQQGATSISKELSMTLDRITDPYQSDNQFIQPKAGNRYLVVHVTVKDVDKSQHTVNEFSFKLKTDDSHVYDTTFLLTGDTGFKAFELSSGEITDGDVGFEIPARAQIVELKYDNGLGSDDLFWRK